MFTLIFQHIPKTGGTSLNELLDKNYHRRDILEIPYNRSPGQPDIAYVYGNPKVIRGHLRYGVHRALTGDYKYLCVLRNPIERVISHYLDRASRDFTGSLEDFLHHPWGSNLIVRMISDNKGLEEAKKNLSEYFVGFTGRLPTFVEKVGTQLGWRYREIGCLNQRWGGTGPDGHTAFRETPDISPELFAKIEERNSLDLALYRHAVNRSISLL